jgi:DNA-directed RNA polymerase specialized sigma24 family protein
MSDNLQLELTKQEAILLLYNRGLTEHEIAKMVGLSQPSVHRSLDKSRGELLARMMKRLAKNG